LVSPFYSPCLATSCPPEAAILGTPFGDWYSISPALLILIFLSNVSLDVSGFEVIQRFYLMPLMILSAFFIFYLADSTQLPRWIPIVLFINIISNIYLNFPINNLRGDSLHEARIMQVLGNIPKDSIIVLEGDSFWSSAIYKQVAENLRPDIIVLSRRAINQREKERWKKLVPDLFKPGGEILPSLFSGLDLHKRRIFTNGDHFVNASNWDIKAIPLLNEVRPGTGELTSDCSPGDFPKPPSIDSYAKLDLRWMIPFFFASCDVLAAVENVQKSNLTSAKAHLLKALMIAPAYVVAQKMLCDLETGREKIMCVSRLRELQNIVDPRYFMPSSRW
jgi:hypothetical protein